MPAANPFGAELECAAGVTIHHGRGAPTVVVDTAVFVLYDLDDDNPGARQRQELDHDLIVDDHPRRVATVDDVIHHDHDDRTEEVAALVLGARAPDRGVVPRKP